MPAESRVFYDLGIIKAEGNITSGDAHIAVNYETVLKLGLINYKERTEKKLKELDLTDYKNLNKSYFYRAIIIVIDAVVDFAKRYADLALELADKETNAFKKSRIIRNVKNIK